MHDPIQESRSYRGILIMMGICTGILIVLALYLARPVFAPLTFALLIIAIVWPLQKKLQAWMPKLAALALTTLTTILVIIVFVSVVAWGFSRVGRYVANNAAYLQSAFGQVTRWLEEQGIVVASLWAEYFNMGWLVRLFQELIATINTTLSFWLIVLIYVILGLLEVDDASQRLLRLKNQKVGQALLSGAAQTAEKLRRYMVVRSLMSVATGALVWGFALLAGLPLAAEWGVIAFALNYIPFIGPFIATLLPTLLAIAQFQSWQMAVIVFACLNLIQFLVGSYVEPRIAGSALSISPFVVLFAVFFWTSLWGISGTFIGVPIVIAVLTICEQYQSSRWVTDLFGEPVREE